MFLLSVFDFIVVDCSDGASWYETFFVSFGRVEDVLRNCRGVVVGFQGLVTHLAFGDIFVVMIL